jgi:hypothetical protein
VILDRANAVIWCDQRSQPQVDFINGALGKDKVLQYTANPVLTGFTLPKLLWVRDHEPQRFERVRKMLLPKGLRPVFSRRGVCLPKSRIASGMHCWMWCIAGGPSR